MGRKVGHLVVILLLRVDRTSGNAKQILSQRYGRTLPPIFIDQTNHRPSTYQAGGLLVPPRNLENLRKRNADNARCVCWVLQNVTDPEAINSAMRLASIVRWFEDDVKADPPYNIIVSSFQECFDPNYAVYPGMRDRAFISRKAIAKIHAHAALRRDRFEFPIPAFLRHHSSVAAALFIEEVNVAVGRGILETSANTLWTSSLLARQVSGIRHPPLIP